MENIREGNMKIGNENRITGWGRRDWTVHDRKTLIEKFFSDVGPKEVIDHVGWLTE